MSIPSVAAYLHAIAVIGDAREEKERERLVYAAIMLWRTLTPTQQTDVSIFLGKMQAKIHQHGAILARSK